MHPDVCLERVSMNPLADHWTGGPFPRPLQETGRPLEALDAIRNQLDTIRDGQRYSNDAINDLLTRPSAQDVVDSQGSVLGTIEGHLQTLTARDQFHGQANLTDAHASSSRKPVLPGGGRSGRNDSPPHPVGIPGSGFDAPTLAARDHTAPRPHVANPETRPPHDQSTPFTGHSRRSTLTRQLHEILSQSDPAPALAIQHPPPLTSLTYEPAPKVRSASPVSVDDSIPQHIASARSLTPSQLRQFRARQQAEPVQRSAELGHPGSPRAINHESDTSPDDRELERQLKRMRTQRLLAVDQTIASGSQQLGTSFRQRPIPRRHELERDTSTNDATELEPRAQELHDRPSATLQGEGGGTHITSSRAVPTKPIPMQARQPPPLRTNGVAPAKPIRPAQPSSSWYHRPSRTQPPSQSRPQQTIVQFPPEPLNRAIELLQDISLGQRTVAEQQREVTRYMRDLNGWLERAVHHRREELGEMDERLGRLQQDIRSIAETGITGVTE